MIKRSEDGVIRVLSLSYGKDSLACIGAIEELGLPLDEIVHAEVWATQEIPADLPPMMEFKKKADAIIKERWGYEVKHICAMQKPAGGGITGKEKPNHTDGATKTCFTEEWSEENSSELIRDSRRPSEVGAKSSSMKKLTYEDIFYRPMKPKKAGGGYRRIYGFPILTHGNWCTALKQRPLRFPAYAGRVVSQIQGRILQRSAQEGSTERSTDSLTPG